MGPRGGRLRLSHPAAKATPQRRSRPAHPAAPRPCPQVHAGSDQLHGSSMERPSKRQGGPLPVIPATTGKEAGGQENQESPDCVSATRSMHWILGLDSTVRSAVVNEPLGGEASASSRAGTGASEGFGPRAFPRQHFRSFGKTC